jgi:hypothetical protein
MSIDLFLPVVPPERFHPAFEHVFLNGTENDKNVLRSWSDGFVDRDGKFVQEFQTTFDSSFWELYLYAVFKELGMRCDFQWPSPDFCISSPDPFTVEATVALHAQGTAGVTDTTFRDMPGDFNEFNRQAIVRLSNSLHSKYKKYVESYSLLPHVMGKPFVLAVAPFDRPHFYLQAQRAIEALLYRFYVDEEAYLKEHPNRDAPLVGQDLPNVVKDSGESLPLGMFCDASAAGISAVIQSTAATWSKVRVMSGSRDIMVEAIYENRAEGGQDVFRGPNSSYQESILDGLRIYHNPYATYPLDRGLFDRAEIFQASATGPAKLINLSDSSRILSTRKVTTFTPGFMEEVVKGMSPTTEFWHHIR